MLSPLKVGKLGASQVAPLMSGDAEEILNLWRELIGDPSYVREDLSGVWAVQLGIHTESFHLNWYERRTGKPLSRRGEFVQHPRCDWACCTLDAFDDDFPAPVEAKHVGGFEKTETIIARYQPQAHWQMMCTGTQQCVFSIIEGAREPIIEIVNFDSNYAAELWSRAQKFMQCVFELRPPVALPPIVAPVKAERIYDMTGNNQWASEAVTWLNTRQAFKDNIASDKALKTMVPADAARCSGHGINISRSKAGSLSIREVRE